MKTAKRTAALLLALLLSISCILPAFASSEAPKKPRGFMVSDRTRNSITFQWTKDEGVTGFIIYRLKDGKYVKTDVVKDSTYTFEGLYSARRYCIGVKAYKKLDDRTVYSPLRTYSAVTRPCAPTYTVWPGAGKAVIELKPVARAEGYEISCASSKDGKFRVVASGSKLKYTIDDLPLGGTYYFRIRSRFTSDGKRYYSAYSKVKSVRDPSAAINAICRRYGADGVQVAVISGRDHIECFNYGIARKATGAKVTDNTKYRVASLTKLMSDVVLMRLQEEGKIKTTANIEKYFGYRIRNPYYPNAPITARMLMTHTASIVDSSLFNNSLVNQSTSLKTLLQSSSSYLYIRPGTFYSYSNFSGALVGAVCEKATGKRINDLAQQYVFDRMNVNASYGVQSIKYSSRIGVCYNPGGSAGQDISRLIGRSYNYTPGTNYSMAQGNLYISAKDYAKMLSALLNDGILPNGTRLLEKRSVDEILKTHFSTSIAGYGYGVWKKTSVYPGKVTYSHTGSAYGMYAGFAIVPSTGQGIVVLTSGAYGNWLDSREQYSICYDIMKTVWGI